MARRIYRWSHIQSLYSSLVWGSIRLAPINTAMLTKTWLWIHNNFRTWRFNWNRLTINRSLLHCLNCYKHTATSGMRWFWRLISNSKSSIEEYCMGTCPKTLAAEGFHASWMKIWATSLSMEGLFCLSGSGRPFNLHNVLLPIHYVTAIINDYCWQITLNR